MTIPDPLTPIVITGGIITNIATDILKHYAARLEGSLAGKILKHSGLLPKNFDDKFGEVLNETLKTLFDRFPEYRVTGIIEFIKDRQFSEQLLSYLLDRKNIDNHAIQEAFATKISSDPYTVIILNRRGIDAQIILQSFFVCYREVLLKHMELPQVFVMLEIFKQTEILVEEIKASEGRLKEYVKELFKDQFAPEQKLSTNLWGGFIRICEEKSDGEIRSSIGRKYIPELYVHREIENQYDEFANKSTWERKAILEKIRANVNSIEKEESTTTELIDKAQSKILEIDNDEKSLVSFLKENVEESSDDLWRRLNSMIVILDPNDEALRGRLDALGDELSEISLAGLQQLEKPLHPKRLDEINQSLLEFSEKLRVKLTKRGILDSLNKKRKSELDQVLILEKRISNIHKLNSLLWEIHNILITNPGQYAYSETEKSLKLIDELLRRDQPLAKNLDFISKTVTVIRRHFQNCFLVVDRAGSGKTNLLCHLAKKYSKSQAAIFVSGRILLDDEFSLENYIVKSISCPEIELNFNRLDQVDDFLSSCSKEYGGDKKLLVFVDGINENPNTTLLRRAIQRLLSKSQTRNILFCLSCRDIFWDYFKDDFWDEYVYELAKGKLYNFTEREFSTALNLYLSYYRIECELRDDALEKCHQPLLLRFFCEAYGSPNSETINQGEFQEIRLKKLFDDYWLRKITNAKFSLGYRTSRDIETFLYNISQFMWKNHVRNIPLKELKRITNLSDLDSDKSVYIRLLDEDIIIEEGSSPKLESWVTFVYDEFMEYTMARGLLNSFPEDAPDSEIKKLLEVLIGNYQKFKSIEGVIGYLSIMLAVEKQKTIWDMLISHDKPWTLVVARSINQLTIEDLTIAEFSALRRLSELEDNIKLEVLKCAERIDEAGLFNLTDIWRNLFQSYITRYQARDHLVQSFFNGHTDALRVFIDGLSHSSADLRAYSIYGLARIQHVEPSITKKIAELKSDQSKVVRRAVAYAMKFFPSEHLNLISLLDDDYPEIREQACISLAESDDFHIGVTLLRIYANENDKDVRIVARKSIQSIAHNLIKREQSLLLIELMEIDELLEMEKLDKQDFN